METNGFRKMSVSAQQKTYGGWAWLLKAIPMLIDAVVAGISSYKMLTSDKGSAKFGSHSDSHWESYKEPTRRASEKQPIYVL